MFKEGNNANISCVFIVKKLLRYNELVTKVIQCCHASNAQNQGTITIEITRNKSLSRFSLNTSKIIYGNITLEVQPR